MEGKQNDFWSKKENIDRLLGAYSEYKTRLFLRRKKYEHGLSPDKLERLSLLAYSNGVQFVSDAQVLQEKNSLAHSIALSIFGLEEFAKALYCHYSSKGWTNLKEFSKYLTSHERKLKIVRQLEGMLVAHQREEEGDPFKSVEGFMESSSKRYELWRQLKKLRTMALYVDYHKGLIAPPQILNKKIAKSILELALDWKRVVRTLFSQSKQVENISLLSIAGFDPKQIVNALDADPNTVRVIISETEKRRTKENSKSVKAGRDFK